MQIRTIILIVLALACGGSAAVGVSRLNNSANDGTKLEAGSILVAAMDMPRGAMLSTKSLKAQKWPKSMIPPGAILRPEDAEGRSVLVPLVRGEPLLEAKLAHKNAGRGLAAMIPHGMRAFTIRTPQVEAGVGGFILPGNNVDVLLTTSSSSRDATGGGATTTLLQNVQVLAVDQRLDAPDSNKVDPKEMKSVTLLVTPDQAAKLDLGMNKGILHLSLRHPEDDQEANTLPATMAQLRFHQEKPQQGTTSQSDAETAESPQPPKSRISQIQTLRGTTRGTILIQRHQR